MSIINIEETRTENPECTTLYDFLKANPGDYDVWDTKFCNCITICFDDDEEYPPEDDYDGFVLELTKKVKLVEKPANEKSCVAVADWSEMIEKNFDKFKAFTKEYWWRDYSDKDKFIYKWIRELNAYVCGYVSESIYPHLLELIKTLEL